MNADQQTLVAMLFLTVARVLHDLMVKDLAAAHEGIEELHVLLIRWDDLFHETDWETIHSGYWPQ